MNQSQVIVGEKYKLVSEVHYESIGRKKPIKIVEIVEIERTFLSTKVHFNILQGSDKKRGSMNITRFVNEYEPYDE